MGVLDFFKKKRKEKLIICFSKDKTEEELLKNFFEAYADKIKSVTNETDKEIINISTFVAFVSIARITTIIASNI